MQVRDHISEEQNKLRPDIELVRLYGEAHPDAWVDLRVENEPMVRIIALLAGDDLATHEEALRRIVSYPDQLEVRPSPWPQVRLEAIRDEIREMATFSEIGLFSGWGTGNGKVNVTLRADGEPVAAQLQERYGDAIDITVGFLHFPECAFPHSRTPRFADDNLPRPSLLPDELFVVATEDLEVRSGNNLKSAMRLTNSGSLEAAVHTNGQLTASVVDPETNKIVGGYSGAQATPLILFQAHPGQAVEIPLLIGTASTVPQLGYAVPPGRWAIEITLPLGIRGPFFRAPPIPLSVTA